MRRCSLTKFAFPATVDAIYLWQANRREQPGLVVNLRKPSLSAEYV